MPLQIAGCFVAEARLDRASPPCSLSSGLLAVLQIFSFRFDLALRQFAGDLLVLFAFIGEFALTQI
jgi:hypothetical protein